METSNEHHAAEVVAEDRDTITRRERDGEASALVRAPRRAEASAALLAKLRYGASVAQSLDVPGVLAVRRVDEAGGSARVVMEDFDGQTLRSLLDAGPLAVEEALRVAVSLADALGAVHGRDVVHKGVEPAHVLVSRTRGEIKLTHFDIASRLSREHVNAVAPSRVEGTLAYVSPEQTGRMNRTVDYRTDLYSLGVTLYEMLVGHPPFVSDDPVQVVYGHIAVEPTPPHAIRPEIPEAVSRVVAKLLAKNAEDRYQSAYGAAADLRECEAALRGSRSLADFAPGRRDVAATFHIPQKLYGRAEETARLVAAFERAVSGPAQLVRVAGYSGVGKSSLVNEIHKPIVRARGYFGAGKFQQLQNAPYRAFIQAFQQIIHDLLAEREEALSALRGELLEALGPNAQVLIDVIPEVELILGPQPAVPALGPTAARTRFNLAFQQFVGAFARREHPLALVLDDMQWADSGSLALLELLLGDPKSSAMLVVCAYRDNETPPAHPLMLTLAEIEKGPCRADAITLSPLGLAHVTELVIDVLGHDDAEARALAALVHRKTEGNPFFVGRFLTSLHERGLVAFDPRLGRWSASLARIEEERITDNVASLMIEKLQSLAPGARRALERASCIGPTFELGLVAAAGEEPTAQTAAYLWEAVREGLVRPVGEGYKYVGAPAAFPAGEAPAVEYAFLHDRIQEAAYARLDEDARQRLHLTLARLLRTDPHAGDARIFELVNHYNAASALLAPDERAELARLDLAAGVRAKNSNAYAAAREYLTTAAALLGPDGWERDDALAYAVHRQLPEVEYLLTHYDAAEAGFEVVLSRTRTKAEKAEVYRLKMIFSQSRGDTAGAVANARMGYALVGIDFPAAGELIGPAIGAELGAIEQNLGGRSIPSLLELPVSTDPEDAARALLLSEALMCGAYDSPDMMTLLMAKLVNHSITRGNAPGSSEGYLMYSIIATAMGNHERAYQLGKLGLALSERLDGPAVRAAVKFVFANFIKPWHEPMRGALGMGTQAFSEAIETGSLFNATAAGMQRAVVGFLAGEELLSLHDLTRKHVEFQQRVRAPTVHVLHSVDWCVLMVLGREAAVDAGVTLDEQTIAARIGGFPPHALETFCIMGLEVALILEDQPRMKWFAARVGAASGHVVNADLWLVQSLYLASLHDAATPEERAQHAATIAQNREQLGAWVPRCPANFRHRHALLLAEEARIAGDATRAAALYDRAIDEAASDGVHHVQALAADLAARFYLSLGRQRSARAYLAEARRAYARWGATAKVADIDRRYGDLLPAGGAPAAREEAAGAASLDLLSVMKASQAISSEIVLDDLLNQLMTTVLEAAGAQHGVLILAGDRRVVVDARRAPGSGAAVVIGGAAEHSSAMVRYVERTRERVVIGEAKDAPQWSADPYLARAQPRSVLCMPILKQQKLIGVLYLENHLAGDAFTPERCQVLELLAAQAAISLENAELYATLDVRVKERTRELSASNQELSRALARLTETQQQLVMQEKLASLGALTSGIAHEIKNPLNFINNFAKLSVGLAEELDAELRPQLDRLVPDSRETIAEIIADLGQNAAKIDEHGQRADNIVRAMLEHSRSGTDDRREIDVNAVVREYVNLAHQGQKTQDTGVDVDVELTLDPSVHAMHLSPQEIGRVVINLFKNAWQAALARQRDAGPSFRPAVAVSTHETGGGVEIRVRDNGVGIPEAIRDKIFNPFFTTKPPGEGTGLGLSISYDIVVQGNGGAITFDSQPGATEFKVSLPRRG